MKTDSNRAKFEENNTTLEARGWSFNPRARESKAFTLLELLVTLLIVLILSSFLFTGVRTARGLANSTICLNNMRQMGIAFRLYATDNWDRLPYTSDFYGAEIAWFNALDPFLLSQEAATNRASRRVHLVKQDPVVKNLGPVWLKDSHTIKMNQWLGRDQNAARRFYSFRELKQPTRTVLLFDGRAETERLRSGAPSVLAMNPEGSEGFVARRHRDGANVLFMDGHAERRNEIHQAGGGLGWQVNKTKLLWKPWMN